MASTDDTQRKDIEGLLNLVEGDSGAKDAEALERILCHTRLSGENIIAPLCTQRGLRVLSHVAFDGSSPTVKGNALRCLNNLLVRSIPTRQLFADEGYPQKVVKAMQETKPDEELATASLLIHSTVGTSLDLTSYFMNAHLADIINANVRNAHDLDAFLSQTAITTFALLSTLAIQYESYAYLFLPSLGPILDILERSAFIPHSEKLVSVLLGCLASLPVDQSEVFPASAANRLVDLLRQGISSPCKSDKELLPLLLVISRLVQSKSPPARQQLIRDILPSDHDRVDKLGEGSTLPHCLLKLCATTMEPEVREIISTIYFDLSDKNPRRFIHHVGFGNAAGYLVSRGIHLSQEEISRYQIEDVGINPVTGQLYDNEPQVVLPPMTQEEKEMEAERLFVLFERLRANGAVSVENPVAQFQESGRFEELPDEESE